MVEHVIGNDGVASPILANGTIFKISAFIADFLFLNKYLFSPILTVLKRAILNKLSDFPVAINNLIKKRKRDICYDIRILIKIP